MSQLEFNSSGFEERITHFADVILPLPLPRKYTYRVPGQQVDDILPGSRVIIQFGKRKIFTGVVSSVHQSPPEGYEAKSILEVLDDVPVVTENQLELFEWMAEYYMCTAGEVLQAALPSGLKLSSESKVQRHPSADFSDPALSLTKEEAYLLDILGEQDLMGISEISERLGKKQIHGILKSLIKKNLILVFEQVSEKYVPRKEKRIVLSPEFRKEGSLEKLLNEEVGNPKQEAVLLGYYQQIKQEEKTLDDPGGIAYRHFTRGDYSFSSVNTLIKKGVLEKFEVIVPRFEVTDSRADVSLTTHQAEAAKQIARAFEQSKPVLLHGITGSGKTEIYIDLINQVLESGQQVLYLLPEIALTTQIIQRLQRSFGKGFGVYHSRYSDNERVEVWNGVLDGSIRFVVGVRSSVFLPFQDLGLVIVDEEHETSYKQYNPAPRYHARDVAIMLARNFHARVLLGTATPSMESYFNATNKKYELVELSRRFGEADLPGFEIVDMGLERKLGKVKGEFSNRLLEEMGSTLDAGDQAIIFQNRRGFAPVINCDHCNWTARCIQCSVSLTYHQYRKELKCHYCGYAEPLPTVCPDCGSSKLRTVGFGTQKLEEDLNMLMPNANLQRMDLDTTRSKSSYERIIGDFEKGDIDVLIGTQIITKGLDFDRVGVVGIVDLDKMLNFPDFRSAERTYHLAVQVSGRAGRREKKGKVLVQTRNPRYSIVQQIKENDWEDFYREELKERKNYNYPPFTRLIKLTVKNKDAALAEKAAADLGKSLKEMLGDPRVLGPQQPVVSRIRNQYLFEIWVKIHRNDKQLGEIKENLIREIHRIQSIAGYSSVRVVPDVDPL